MIKTYKTTDLATAAGLITAGFQMDSFEKNKNRDIEMNFESSQELIDALNRYAVRDLYLDAQTYALNLKALKNQINAHKNNL